MSKRKNRGRNLLRQKKLAKEISGNVSLKEAAIRAGYSESYADSGKITKTESWQELMDKCFPDRLVARQHKKLLTKKEVVIVVKGKTKQKFLIKEIDANAVAKALDMAYKLRGRYKGTQPENEIAKTFHEIVARIGRLFPDSKPG